MENHVDNEWPAAEKIQKSATFLFYFGRIVHLVGTAAFM
jgi:hypothetical protein